MRVAFLLTLIASFLFCFVTADNFYEILGVAGDADEGVIKKAYRKLSLKYHPGACACWDYISVSSFLILLTDENIN